MYNKDEVARLGVDIPQDFADLTDPQYKGLIWTSNYNTAGTAKLIINTVIQKYGHDEGIKYLVDLDKNIQVYTKSGSGPSKNVGTGECVIGLGFLHDVITQIVDNGYDNIGMVIPSSGTTCVNIAKDNGSYQFLVLDNAEQPEIAYEFGLDPSNVIDYDYDDATNNIKRYVEEVMSALAASGAATDDTSRFQVK